METNKQELMPPTRSSTPIVDHTQPQLRLFGDTKIIDLEASVRLSSVDDGVRPRLKRLEPLSKALCQGIGAVHRIHKCPVELRRMLYRGLLRYLSQFTDERSWVAGAKWILTFPIARYLGCDEPKDPGSSVKLLFHKRYFKWLLRRMGTFSEKNTFFFTSWLQSKRGCEQLSDLMRAESYIDHFNGMCTEDPMTDDLFEEVFSQGTNFVKLLDLVRKRLHKEIRDRGLGHSRPSRHAAYNSTRGAGGQRGRLVGLHMAEPISNDLIPERVEGHISPERRKEIRDYNEFLLNRSQNIYLFDCAVNEHLVELYGMDYAPVVLQGDRVHSNRSVGIYAHPLFSAISEKIDRGEVYHYQDTDGGLPRAKIASVFEPLKIRNVSSGPAELYYSLKSFQLRLHKSLREIPLFRLIGRPQCSTDLSDLINDKVLAFSDPQWLSADYSSATDNLSSSLSKEILYRITKGLDPGLITRASAALGAHIIEYPAVDLTAQQCTELCIDRLNESGQQGTSLRWNNRTNRFSFQLPSVIQNNGQLMGSIVSFPILCLANAAALDRFQRNAGLDLSFKEYLESALINGDDLVTAVDGKDSLYAFKGQSKDLGLDLTVGKSYIHPVYANINSSAFHYNLPALRDYHNRRSSDPLRSGGKVDWLVRNPEIPGHLPTPVPVGYFNSGLYAEKHKVMERVGSQVVKDDSNLSENEEFTADLHDPERFSYGTLPRGALKLKERLERKGFVLPQEGDRPFWAVCNRIFEGTPEHQRNDVQRELSLRIRAKGEDIFFYRTAVDKRGRWRWGRRNHCLPISAGGLGLFPQSALRFRINSTQRRLSNYLRQLKLEQGFRVDSCTPLCGSQKDDLRSRHVFAGLREVAVDISAYEYPHKMSDRGRVTPIIPSGGPRCLV